MDVSKKLITLEDAFESTGDDRLAWKNGELELSVEQVDTLPSVIPYVPHIVNCPAADPADRFDGLNTMNHPNLPPNVTNPNKEPTGHFTGRCMRCGSNDLWDDNLHYGCNNCGAFYSADSNPAPQLRRDDS